jgi:DNA-binding IclR family transcriptional regulator
MKKYLITSILFLVLALMATVLVFILVSGTSETTVEPIGREESTETDSPTPVAIDTDIETVAENGTSSSEGEPVAGIPVSDLPLTDGQAEALGTLGIDAETFVITPEMIICAESRLSAERVDEIVAGATPTLFETARLSTCLISN